MVRGRRRTPSSNQKYESQGNILLPLSQSPSKPKARRKFKGKLAHTSPITLKSPNTITKYYDVKLQQSTFNSQENSPVFTTSMNSPTSVCQDLPATEDLKRKVLQEANNRSENNRFNKVFNTGQNDINKTETCVPLSPSTALSHLNLNSTRKLAKVKPRLLAVSEITVKSQTTLTEFFPVRRSIRKTGKTVLEEIRRTIEEAILTNKEDGLEVRNFEGKGRGVVAARNFKKGEFVVEYAGELISMEEAQKREAIYSRNENIGCYMYYFKHKNNQHCIDATAESGRLGRLLNHSRNGNLSTKTIEVNDVPHLILTAKEDIEPGCELTYDYGDRSKQSLQYHPWLAL